MNALMRWRHGAYWAVCALALAGCATKREPIVISESTRKSIEEAKAARDADDGTGPVQPLAEAQASGGDKATAPSPPLDFEDFRRSRGGSALQRTSSRTRWRPGTPHPQLANVVAGRSSGQWLPASGYTGAAPDDEDDFRVRRVASAGVSRRAGAASGSGIDPDWVAAGVLLAVAKTAHNTWLSYSDSLTLDDQFTAAAALLTRDAALGNAVDRLLPHLPRSERQDLAALLTVSMDTPSRAASFLSLTRTNAVQSWLRGLNPRFSDLASYADVIAGVVQRLR